MTTLGEQWRQTLETKKQEREAAAAAVRATTAKERAEEIIQKIPAILDAAMAAGQGAAVIGDFQRDEISGNCNNVFPQEAQLSGTALLIYRYCQKESLFLYSYWDLQVIDGPPKMVVAYTDDIIIIIGP